MKATQVTTHMTPCGSPLPELEVPMINTLVTCLGSEHRKLDDHILQLAFAATTLASDPDALTANQRAVEACRNVRSALVKGLVASLGGRDLVIGVDRLDYSKGLIQRFDAFDIFLANHRAWVGKVTYLQITPKTRSEIPEFAEIEKAASAAAGRINGKYGEVSWTPIRYVNRVYSRSVLAGLYRTARVGLVTPLRDGMNLVAKEYVAAQIPDDPGVLILSRFAGTAIGFRRALLVNPYDAESVAGAIAHALAMPLEERRSRHQALLAVVSEYDVDRWQREFLTALRGDDGATDQLSALLSMNNKVRSVRPESINPRTAATLAHTSQPG